MQQQTAAIEAARKPGASAASDLLLFHFVGDRLLDGRPVPADGELLSALSGGQLAGYPTAGEAMAKAEGTTLCLVTLLGAKRCAYPGAAWSAGARLIVKRIDAAPLLRAFAMHCAQDVLQFWDAPEIIGRYLSSADQALGAQVRQFFPEDQELYWPGSPYSYALQCVQHAASPDPIDAARLAAMGAAAAHGAMARVEAYSDASYVIDPGELIQQMRDWPRPELGDWDQAETRAYNAASSRLDAHFERMVGAAFNMRGFA